MTTLINNDFRVYQVLTSTGKQYFCNIQDLNEICKDMHQGYFKIYHFWNNKPVKLSRKALDHMFEGAQLKRNFNY